MHAPKSPLENKNPWRTMCERARRIPITSARRNTAKTEKEHWRTTSPHVEDSTVCCPAGRTTDEREPHPAVDRPGNDRVAHDHQRNRLAGVARCRRYCQRRRRLVPGLSSSIRDGIAALRQ